MTTRSIPSWPWPTDRAISFAMHTFQCDEETAIEALVDLRMAIARVGREFDWSMDEAAIQVIRLEPITPPLMARHRMTKAEAVIELIRARPARMPRSRRETGRWGPGAQRSTARQPPAPEEMMACRFICEFSGQ